MKYAYGFVRVACVSPRIKVANPEYNAGQIIEFITQNKDLDVILFPELCITGYTCADLFGSRDLLIAAEKAVHSILEVLNKIDHKPIVIVGCPVPVGNVLYNCGLVLFQRQIASVVPKRHLPNYKEFYEQRWFAQPNQYMPFDKTIKYADCMPQINHSSVVDIGGLRIGVEICEDLWMPIPPSCYQAHEGATILCNLSASNDVVTKSEYRRSLVVNQSARCIAGYMYSSCGPSESTSDLVFSGHCMIAENGHMLAESTKVGDFIVAPKVNYIRTEIDTEKLMNDRRKTNTYFANKPMEQRVEVIRVYSFADEGHEPLKKLTRPVSANPFIPSSSGRLYSNCAEVVSIQATGLAHRLEVTKPKKLMIGVSGGLDSTLALLVTCMACDALKLPRETIHGITMPGFGTTKRTKTNAKTLMTMLGITQQEVDIKASCMQTFQDMKHKPFGLDLPKSVLETVEFENKLIEAAQGKADLVFENVQARARTNLLMNSGFVIGTGDMSEMALGWCTYNGDHMSMYNVNCSIPKTLVRFLVHYIANNLKEFNSNQLLSSADPEKLKQVLIDIVETPISPELLPTGKDKDSTHKTESVIGPYELHDFFLFHRIRNGFTKTKILFLAVNSQLINKYSEEDIKKWYDVFIKRFFDQQFKRNCVPDGPKVGSISLSPRGDWRMPSDAEIA